MGIYINDLRGLVVRPTLEHLHEWSQTAENLLLGTAAQESQLGYRMLSNNHGGLGIFNISPQTHLDLWDNYLVTDPELASLTRGLASQQLFLKNPHGELITNLSYSTAMAWMIYKRHNLQLPSYANALDLARYWLNHYRSRNHVAHQTTVNDEHAMNEFAQNFQQLVLRKDKNIAA